MAYTTAGFGATINGKHTLKDYGLVVSNTDIVETPIPKTSYVDIPGSSTRLDLTTTLTGQVEYSSRKLTFSLGGFMSPERWPIFYNDLLNLYQGKEVQVILDQEPEYYYHGRAELSGFSRNQMLGIFTLTVDADAYKYERITSIEAWQWDIFNFETGIIREYGEMSVSGTKTMKIDGSKIPVVPVFYVSGIESGASAYISYSGKRYNLANGKNRFADLAIPTIGATLYFYGTFTMMLEFRGGSL